MTARLVECPNGHRVKPIPVIYGMPDPDLLSESEPRRIRLGGCDPTVQDDRVGDCPKCGGAPIPLSTIAQTTATRR